MSSESQAQGKIILTRYLLLMGHLITVSTLLTSRKENVMASLPYEYSQEDYDNIDYEFTVNLSLSLAFVILELITFGSGLSMFSSLATLISIMAHFIATTLLCFFSFDQWDISVFWWVFVFGNCVPVTFDLGSIVLDLFTLQVNKFYS